MAQKLGLKIGAGLLESFKMWCWRRTEKIKWSEKPTNEGFLERIEEKRILLNNILRRKANWISHIQSDDGSKSCKKYNKIVP